LAWGLYTHVYFAQLLIWAIPLANSRFRRAVQRFPELMLAGACLPDTALFSEWSKAPALRATHEWSIGQRMLACDSDDESLAISAGYASHLLTDIIAHNYFVPAHERLWFDCPVVTHAACEWAMDVHVGPQLFALPRDLLRRHRARLARHAAQRIGCPEHAAARALRWLGNGEKFLRATRLPFVIHRGARTLDSRISRRCDHYVSETARRLHQINRLIAGDSPLWQAEPPARTRKERARSSFTQETLQVQPLPQDLF
jgi:Zinc dependent phospholipase C